MPRALIARVTLELQAGNAAMIDLGKMLGPHGVPTIEVKRRYDGDTAKPVGEVIPAIVSIFDDRTWDMSYKTPPTSFLIKQIIRGKGASRPGNEVVGTLTTEELRRIAERKLPDLNTSDVEAAMKQIEGTARSMGVRVRD